MNDAGAEYDAVGTDHFGDGQCGRDLHDGNAGFLQLGCDRSAAAGAGASGRGEDHRVDTLQSGLCRHLAAEPARIR